MPGPPKPPPPNPPPSPRRSSMLLLSSPSICMVRPPYALAYSACAMSLTIATWNINSVRLRIGNVERYLRLRKPDVLCLQETKCPDEFFPHHGVRGAGIQASPGPGHEILQRRGDRLEGAVHRHHHPSSLRQGGLPPHRGRARHRRRSDPARQSLHPGRRRHSRPRPEREVRAQARFLPRDGASWYAERKPRPRARKGLRRIAVGDLNVAPLEHDVWSHKQLLKIVSHTPVEVDLFGRMQASLDWIDVPRRFVAADKKLYSWWSYRNNDWRVSNRGRRLDHILATPALVGCDPQLPYRRGPARLGEGIGPCAGAGDVRGMTGDV